MRAQPGDKNIIQQFDDVDTFERELARGKFLTLYGDSVMQDCGLYMYTYTEEELLQEHKLRATFIKFIDPIEKMMGFVMFHGIKIPV